MPRSPAGVTRRGWGMLALAAAMASGAALFGVQELYPLAVGAVVLVAGCRVWVSGQSWDLRVDRNVHPTRLPAGSDTRVELTVTNHRARRSPLVAAGDPFDGGRRWARFSIAPIPPKGTRTASYRLQTPTRGVFTLGPLELELSDPFGLARLVRTSSYDASITVHPRVERVSARSVSSVSEADTRVPLPVFGQGADEFYGLREYQAGDDLRMVHWPSTARIGTLVLRQAENMWRGRTTVALDMRAAVHDADSFEALLSAAASIVNAGIRNGLHVRMVGTDGSDSGFGSTDAHRAMLLDALAAAHCHHGTTLTAGLGMLAPREPVTVLTTERSSEADLAGARRMSAGRGGRLVVFELCSGAGKRALPSSGYLRVPAGAPFAALWERSSC